MAREAIVNELDETLSFKQCIDDLTTVHGTMKPNTILFMLADGDVPGYLRSFATLLKDLGLDIEPGSRTPRSLYSLRHYYANRKIDDGIEIFDLAHVMGSSLAMIHQYYGKALSRLRQAEASGVDRRSARLAAAIRRDMVGSENARDNIEELDADAELAALANA